MVPTMKENLSRPVRLEYTTKVILTVIFLGMFAGFIYILAVVKPGDLAFDPSPLDLVLLVFATFRLGRMVAYDHVMEPFRSPFARTVTDSTGAGESVEPRGVGVRKAIGQLITCPICAGTWIAALLVYAFYAFPAPTKVFLVILGAIGAAELLNGMMEIFCWGGQYARTMAGEKMLSKEHHAEPEASYHPGNEPPAHEKRALSLDSRYAYRQDCEDEEGYEKTER